MGIKGSSTRTVYFDNARVPVENVLGEVGKGHKIAFNILNIGRLKLGAVAARRRAQRPGACAREVRHRAQGLRQDAAAVRPDPEEAGRHGRRTPTPPRRSTYRTAGLIEEALRDRRTASPDAALKAIEEYAMECSIVKVLGSETLAHVVDEGVQIFGGYGFMHEYPVEKAYRDARITRIFEGTNEINRLLLSGTLFKRAMAGRVAVMDAVCRPSTRRSRPTKRPRSTSRPSCGTPPRCWSAPRAPPSTR